MPAPSDRLPKLQQMLQRSPDDTFVLYGIALEFKNQGEPRKAIEFLSRVIELDWGYCYAYHQKGLVYESLGDLPAARRAYRQGIAAAGRKGDGHAQSEIAAALALID